MLKRKGTLLLGEVLKLADHCLPTSANANIQVLHELLAESIEGGFEDGALASGVIYQIDSVNRTLQRSGHLAKVQQSLSSGTTNQNPNNFSRPSGPIKSKLGVDMDEIQFRALLLETQVLTTANHLKWKWDLINDLIEGPLCNPKRLEESIKASKFMKRLVAFYRPFKYKFSEARNTKPNQRYVRVGCALVKTLLQNPEGIAYLSESKLLRQLAECLAQLDRQSGLTSTSPLFSPYKVSETLTGGYFAILGALSSDPHGLQMIERWRMVNMFYHIMELDTREDLIRALLCNMDFSLDSHLRVMLSKALTACPKSIRAYATRLLRKYATSQQLENDSPQNGANGTQWAIRILVTQLYDPEVQVCEIAVEILEEVCNRKEQLEYVVRCRPALDHLGAIGAPLLLRFLSTSLGYQYLDGLDYINHEMDDWFLGRNDSYVMLVEASLSRALMVLPERPKTNSDEQIRSREYGTVPPHFYRELTRTVEGCQLLRKSRHFNEFVANIQDSWSDHDEPETMIKLKGSLWAVGNVGSVELGAPFLEETDVVDCIIKIAMSSEVMTMRGTAFFVLGLISRSLHGMEILTEYGWTAATDHLGRSLGYCLPPNLEELTSMASQNLKSPPQRVPPPVPTGAVDGTAEPDNALPSRIIVLIVEAGNPVITMGKCRELQA
jgi:rapamycin-insensitive companion of mTOR